MTCIVALVDQGVTYFAGDSLVVTVPSQYHSRVSQGVRHEPKIWAKDGMLYGGNGSVRMLQLLRYMHTPPAYVAGQDKVQYLVSTFIPSLQECCSENEYSVKELDGGILLAWEGKLFTINNEFGVNDTVNAYESVGQASVVAIGSLHTTGTLHLPPLQRLYLALRAAERHTCVVSAPFRYISSELTDSQELLPMID